MKMNLHKINKLLVELKQKINEKNVGATISINVDTSASSEQVQADIEKSVSNVKEELSSVLALREDYFDLKTKLFEKNLEVGVSKVVSKLNYLKQNKVILENLLRYSDNNSISLNFIKKEYLEDKKNLTREGGNTSYRLNVSCFDKEYLNSEIKKMKKEISENEDKLSELNIQTKIDVNLSSTTLKVLNLD